MCRSRACARASAVAWPAEGVSAKSKPTAAAKAKTMARRILAIQAAIRNRLLGRIGRVGWAGASLWKLPSEEAERRVPSAPNGPALRCECGYRIYNEHGGRAMPRAQRNFPFRREAHIRGGAAGRG